VAERNSPVETGRSATGRKSASAFRTISEVAGELDVPPHVLRFWEMRFSNVRPLKRAGGRRYYRPEDIDLLRRIRDLLYSQGYTIKGVQKLMREGALKPVQPEAERKPAPVVPAEPTSAQRDIKDELKALLLELRGLADLLRRSKG
jgi:DNA-binding transcriptional MerR regulator